MAGKAAGKVSPPPGTVKPKHSEGVKAMALALMQVRGESPAAIARALSVPERTVYHWVERWQKMAGERTEVRSAMLAENDRIIRRASMITHDILDAYVDIINAGDPERIAALAKDVTVMRGVALDKADKLEQGAPPDRMPFVIILREESPQATPDNDLQPEYSLTE